MYVDLPTLHYINHNSNDHCRLRQHIFPLVNCNDCMIKFSASIFNWCFF